jgi:4-hydroxybenzoyl-CoA thioesterase
MGRVKLHLPDHLDFSTDIEVHIGYINYGNHLGNDSMLTLLHEARVRFLKSLGYSELDIEGQGIILSDAVIVYRSEGLQGECLTFDVGVGDFSRYGCDVFYRVHHQESGREVARAKTGIVFFDYDLHQPVAVPEPFRARFPIP